MNSKKKQAPSHTKDLEIIYGVHPLVELLKAKRRKLISLYTTKPTPQAWHLIEPLISKMTTIHYVDKASLTKMAQSPDHQSFVGFATPFVKRKKFFQPNLSPFLLLLESIQDPRNLGALLRSAYCTGVDGIILCGKQSAPLGATALKASAGLAEHLDIYEAPTAQHALDLLKKEQYSIYLATLSGSNATGITYKKPLCLVIGNEATGIAKPLLTQGTQIRLAQRDADISYNASVAGGILLFLIAHDIKAFEKVPYQSDR